MDRVKQDWGARHSIVENEGVFVSQSEVKLPGEVEEGLVIGCLLFVVVNL